MLLTYFFSLFIFWSVLGFCTPPIYVIGDSHVRTFYGIPHCYPHHLGPRTMHRMGRDGFHPAELEQSGIHDGAVIVYVFGEIDVRYHIGRQRDIHQRDEEEVLHTLATRYLQAILQNQSYYSNLMSIVYNIVPPIDIKVSPTDIIVPLTDPVFRYPVYGPLEERVRLTRRLNEILRSLCLEFGFLYLQVYDEYCDENGGLRYELSDGNVHIQQYYNQPIQQQLFKIIADAQQGHP